MTSCKWIGIFLMLFSLAAMAEGGCPAGQYPIGGQGAVGCAPMPPDQSAQQQASRPLGKWIKTWGAVAMGEVGLARDYGVSTGKLSKKEAEQDALARCSKNGAANCQVGLAYFNQCVAVGEPQVEGRPDLMGTVSFNGEGSLEKAISSAQAGCEKKNPQNSCKVIYKACTDQVFKKF